MGEPEARRILREEREKATAERKAAERKPVTSQEAYEGSGSNEELLDILTSHGVVTDPDEMHAHALWVTLINWRNASSKGVADMYQRAKAELSARVEAESAGAAAGSYAELPRITDGITGDEAYASAMLDLTFDEIRTRVAGLDAATARAEQAEAALAEMRHERKFDTRMFRRILEALDEDERSGWSGDALSRLVCDLRGDICDRLAEREADATPRTDLERAADEQGVRPVRCGGECSEGHTYEPGSCEAAVDPDEVIAQNHTDAMQDWGIANKQNGGGND